MKYYQFIKNIDGVRYHKKISNTLKRKHLSGEMSPTFLGKKHTEETKKIIGSKSSIHQSGTGNSQYVTCWIYNEQGNKKIKKEELNTYLEDGYTKGRK